MLSCLSIACGTDHRRAITACGRCLPIPLPHVCHCCHSCCIVLCGSVERSLCLLDLTQFGILGYLIYIGPFIVKVCEGLDSSR